jgi:TonB family protein
MKVCPTCQQQYPNGFQYCPNDTELLLTAEEFLRRTVRVEPVVTKPVVERVVERAQPVPVVERVIERAQPVPAVTEQLLSPQVVPNSERTRTELLPEVPVQPPKAVRSVIPEPPAESSTRQAAVSPQLSSTGSTEDRGMSFMLPEQGSVGRQLREGFGEFVKYFGKRQKSEGSAALLEQQRGVLSNMGEGLGVFFEYFGKKQQAGDIDFLVPEEGGIVTRLKESWKIFVDDFGKKAPEFHPGEMGLLPDDPILARFGNEVKLAAADFRRDPKGFVVSVLKGEGNTRRRQRLIQAGVASAMITYAFIFISVLLTGLIHFGKVEGKPEDDKVEQIAELVVPTATTKEAPKEAPKGKGGFTGGSKPKVQQAHGGGGGGREQPEPPSLGRPPQMALTPQIVPPNPEPPKIKNPSLPVPMTVYGDPKALPQLKGPIGDPRGVPAPPSSGPGSGDGIGTNKGSGVGSGEGPGVGPGRGGNAGGGDMGLGGGPRGTGSGGIESQGVNGVGRIVILYKEKARYTEEARQNKIQGRVLLSAIFTLDGRVTNIKVVHGLTDGLTEKAIEAAQKIKFQPATKGGVPVTVRGQLEYTFNLY